MHLAVKANDQWKNMHLQDKKKQCKNIVAQLKGHTEEFIYLFFSTF